MVKAFIFICVPFLSEGDVLKFPDCRLLGTNDKLSFETMESCESDMPKALASAYSGMKKLQGDTERLLSVGFYCVE